jgi:tRNA(Ile)-lysidine synthase
VPVAPVSDAEFAARLARLGPFEPQPALAVGVSGGADSLASAVLAQRWAAACGGRVLALLVDHGLRAAAAEEIRATVARLEGLGVAWRVLTLTDLPQGASLPARARAARHAALERACAEAGVLHLLLGHHAADQAETLCMRLLAGSLPAGLAGMAALVERPGVRLLRPLLDLPPARLRATLRASGLGWVEDPSNHDAAWQRARIRALRADADGTGLATAALVAAAAVRGRARLAAEQAAAVALARAVTLFPLGHALWQGALPPAALAALLGLIGGREMPLSAARVAALAAAPRPATIAGVRILPAGRLGPGLLVVREAQAVQAPVAAVAGAVWDGRFRLARAVPPGHTLGAWGEDAPRDRADLPVAVRQVQPALRCGDAVVMAGRTLLEGPVALVEPLARPGMTGAGFCGLNMPA